MSHGVLDQLCELSINSVAADLLPLVVAKDGGTDGGVGRCCCREDIKYVFRTPCRTPIFYDADLGKT